MSAATYRPRRGSCAQRVIAHLQAQGPGASLTTRALAEALNVPANGLSAALEPACLAGVLRRTQQDQPSSPPTNVYSLGDTPAAAPGEEGPRRRPSRTAPAAPDIRWCQWDDGDLVIYGLQENEDGSHTLPAVVLDQIKQRLAWTPLARPQPAA